LIDGPIYIQYFCFLFLLLFSVSVLVFCFVLVFVFGLCFIDGYYADGNEEDFSHTEVTDKENGYDSGGEHNIGPRGENQVAIKHFEFREGLCRSFSFKRSVFEQPK